MLRGFLEGGKERSMEDIVDSPCFRKIKLVCHMRYFGGYPKGFILPWGEFRGSFYLFQVCSF